MRRAEIASSDLDVFGIAWLRTRPSGGTNAGVGQRLVESAQHFPALRRPYNAMAFFLHVNCKTTQEVIA